ncbi:hypothetical protein D3C85_1178680 [compost metagenome]
MQPLIEEYLPGASPTNGLWASLGFPSRGSKLHECIRNGLPFSFLEHLSRETGLKVRVLSEAVGISRSTLARRAKAGRLTCVESDRLYSIATTFDTAIELFEGDVLAVRDWMTSPVRGIDGKAPMKMLGTRVESRAVLDLIGRLEHGVIA